MCIFMAPKIVQTGEVWLSRVSLYVREGVLADHGRISIRWILPALTAGHGQDQVSSCLCGNSTAYVLTPQPMY